MTRILVCALLLLAAPLALVQQQPPPQGQPPAQASPPVTYPENRGQPQPSPSPTATPEQNKAGVNSQIQNQVQSALKSDPVLSGANVQASVDDQSINVTGTVESEAQHDRVLQLLGPYMRYRSINDKVKVK